MKITDFKSGATVMDTEPISRAEFVSGGNSVLPIGLELETNKLVPSLYRLEVQAWQSSGPNADAWPAVPAFGPPRSCEIRTLALRA